MKTKQQQITELKVKLGRVRCRCAYWKRMATNPRHEADRKKRWRQENPAKYDLELFKNRIRSTLRRLP